MDMKTKDILERNGVIPVSAGVLKSEFGNYKSPLDKISELEDEGCLIRLKRGLYLNSSKVTDRLISNELVANIICGPSYVSMETALRHYGLIPEAVFMTRSITLGRFKQFVNCLGTFEYIHCEPDYYPIGVNQTEGDGYSFLIASPEKALCDQIIFTQKLRPRSIKDMRVYLEDDLRLDMDMFFNMDPAIFKQCSEVCRKKEAINNLIRILSYERV